MNVNIKRDQVLLESMISKYGKSDVVKYINKLDEGVQFRNLWVIYGHWSAYDESGSIRPEIYNTYQEAFVQFMKQCEDLLELGDLSEFKTVNDLKNYTQGEDDEIDEFVDRLSIKQNGELVYNGEAPLSSSGTWYEIKMVNL